MKKFLSIVFSLLLITSLMSIGAFAISYNPNDICDIQVTLKKADPSKVIKDGIIGDGEYEKAPIDTSEDSTSLDIAYGSSMYYDDAISILNSIEYYFSWDDVHGFNFAVKCKMPEGFRDQLLSEGTGDIPGDNFLCMRGFMVASDETVVRDVNLDKSPFHYAIAKRTDNGNYLEGHYQQYGLNGYYNPEPGTDFVITYGDAGECTMEWSIPFNVLTKSSSVGSSIYFSLTASAGNPEDIENEDGLREHFIAIGLGDISYGTTFYKGESSHAEFIISDEAVSGSQQGGGNADTGDNGGGTQVVTEIETVLTTDAEGNTVVETRVVPKNVPASSGSNTSAGKRTGDPMIIFAAVSAVSACGIVVFRKKH